MLPIRGDQPRMLFRFECRASSRRAAMPVTQGCEMTTSKVLSFLLRGC